MKAALGYVLLHALLAIADYCTVGPSSNLGSNIARIVLRGESGVFTYTPGCPGTIGLDNQTGTTSPIKLKTGKIYSLLVTYGSCGYTKQAFGTVWADFNQNSLFDSGEVIGTWRGWTTATVEYTYCVPNNAVLGRTRFRIMQREANGYCCDPCQSFTYGSVIDLPVDIAYSPVGVCSVPSSPPNVTVPGAPATPTVLKHGVTWAVVSWMPPSDQGADVVGGGFLYRTGYREYGDPNDWVAVKYCGLNDRLINVTGLHAKPAYAFAFSAVNSYGEGVLSAQTEKLDPYRDGSKPSHAEAFWLLSEFEIEVFIVGLFVIVAVTICVYMVRAKNRSYWPYTNRKPWDENFEDIASTEYGTLPSQQTEATDNFSDLLSESSVDIEGNAKNQHPSQYPQSKPIVAGILSHTSPLSSQEQRKSKSSSKKKSKKEKRKERERKNDIQPRKKGELSNNIQVPEPDISSILPDIEIESELEPGLVQETDLEEAVLIAEEALSRASKKSSSSKKKTPSFTSAFQSPLGPPNRGFSDIYAAMDKEEEEERLLQERSLIFSDMNHRAINREIQSKQRQKQKQHQRQPETDFMVEIEDVNEEDENRDSS